MPQRVLTVSPMPPEKCAYALARYSRSPDSISDSIEWVRTHDSAKFLESFYFQYGHASIADLGHLAMCFEGVSELAATEIEDEQLWDGQARSSRYQDFSRACVQPPEFSDVQAAAYLETGGAMIDAYKLVHARVSEWLKERLPRPESMKEDMYRRNIAARAFDVARYLLLLGAPTGVGQVTSIRTLEQQIARLKASEFAELRELGDEIASACSAPPVCRWGNESVEPVAPTLARHAGVHRHRLESRAALRIWASQNLPARQRRTAAAVELLRPTDAVTEIAATLLYPVTDWPFRDLYELIESWSAPRRMEVIDAALASRSDRDDLLREFRGMSYAFDIVMDVGAYRDLHRHRRCQQFRQDYGITLGFDSPDAIVEAGVKTEYDAAMTRAFEAASAIDGPARAYALPFATRGRFLFKMDFAEAEYICRIRSGVKGHFSYRRIAWEMKLAMERAEPVLGRLLQATPPSVEDPLKR